MKKMNLKFSQPKSDMESPMEFARPEKKKIKRESTKREKKGENLDRFSEP